MSGPMLLVDADGNCIPVTACTWKTWKTRQKNKEKTKYSSTSGTRTESTSRAYYKQATAKPAVAAGKPFRMHMRRLPLTTRQISEVARGLAALRKDHFEILQAIANNPEGISMAELGRQLFGPNSAYGSQKVCTQILPIWNYFQGNFIYEASLFEHTPCGKNRPSFVRVTDEGRRALNAAIILRRENEQAVKEASCV